MNDWDGSHWSYFHDGRDRLTKAERYDTDGTTLLHPYTYTLDANGNVLTKAVYDPGVGTDTTTFAYNAANEQTTMTDGGGTTTFAYDAWGQMTSKDDGTYTATYAYRYEGKLHAVTTDFPGESNVTYEYGGDGKRRARISGVDETWYNWDREWNVVSEEDDADGSSGDLTRTCVNGGDTLQQVEATLADVEGDDPSTGDYHYYALDHLGSVRGLFDQAKSSVASAEYEPYGAVYAASGAAMPQAFTGKPYDGASGLHYFPYRNYGATQMRWITRDPMEMVDGPNVYLYVAASPVYANDLMGLSATCTSPHFPSTIRGIVCNETNICGIFGDYNRFLVPQGYGRANFQSCCCCHDNCYCTSSRCDEQFLWCLNGKCQDVYPMSNPLRRNCLQTATTMYFVVSAFRFMCNFFRGR